MKAGSTFSKYAAEARNIDSKHAEDSYESGQNCTPNTQDRAFVDDSSQPSQTPDPRELFFKQALQSIGISNSPRRSKTAAPNTVYCEKGHKVENLFQVPHDNLKRRQTSNVSCSSCCTVIPADMPAFNCECGSYVLCSKCVEAGSAYPPPPKCCACNNDLHSKAFSTCKNCGKCERVTGKREQIWMCSSKTCKMNFCEMCFPPSSKTSPQLHSRPSDSSTSAASKDSPLKSRATSAPMPGKRA